MEIEIADHARERMKKYEVSEELVIKTINSPDNVVDSYTGRKVYQKKLNDVF